MATRNVYRTKKDEEGDILALCNTGEWWSPRSKADAISDIDNGDHSYYSNGRARITVVEGSSGKYLRTGPNSSTSDNLDELPDC